MPMPFGLKLAMILFIIFLTAIALGEIRSLKKEIPPFEPKAGDVVGYGVLYEQPDGSYNIISGDEIIINSTVPAKIDYPPLTKDK